MLTSERKYVIMAYDQEKEQEITVKIKTKFDSNKLQYAIARLTFDCIFNGSEYIVEPKYHPVAQMFATREEATSYIESQNAYDGDFDLAVKHNRGEVLVLLKAEEFTIVK
jgi:hypothetical protein